MLPDETTIVTVTMSQNMTLSIAGEFRYLFLCCMFDVFIVCILLYLPKPIF